MTQKREYSSEAFHSSLEVSVYELLKKYQYTLTTAESCTGGLIASTLINVPGISEYFQEGYVTYSNDAKVKMLGVRRDIIDVYSVVSSETAAEMAQCAAKLANTNVALSVTGVAGPDGGTAECPVGTVYLGCFLNGTVITEHHIFQGDRQAVRKAAAKRALELLIEQIGKEKNL